MLHNPPMAIRNTEIKKSSWISNTVGLIFLVGMFAYCMYLISELPLPL